MKEFPTYFTGKHALSMTLRDYFAAKAMQADIGTISKKPNIVDESYYDMENISERAYAMADAMMEARKK